MAFSALPDQSAAPASLDQSAVPASLDQSAVSAGPHQSAVSAGPDQSAVSARPIDSAVSPALRSAVSPPNHSVDSPPTSESHSSGGSSVVLSEILELVHEVARVQKEDAKTFKEELKVTLNPTSPSFFQADTPCCS